MGILSTTIQWPIPTEIPRGLNPLRVARNGVGVSALHYSRLVNYFNMVAGKRFKVHFSKSLEPSDAINTQSATNAWEFMGHTSPNCTEIYMDMILVPIENAATQSFDPNIIWTTAESGGTSTAQATINLSAERGDVNAIPNEFIHVRQKWTDLDGTGKIRDITFQAGVQINSKARPVACCVYEVPRTGYTLGSITDGTETAVIPSYQNSYILDAPYTDLANGIDTLWDRQGANICSWCTKDGAALTITGGTTLTNPWDSTTNQTAITKGFPYRNEYRGSRNSSNIPVVFWVRAEQSGPGAGEAALLVWDRDGASSATVATITGIGSKLFYHTTFGSLNLDSSMTDCKLDVHIRTDNAGGTMSLYSCGVYEYLT